MGHQFWLGGVCFDVASVDEEARIRAIHAAASSAEASAKVLTPEPEEVPAVAPVEPEEKADEPKAARPKGGKKK